MDTCEFLSSLLVAVSDDSGEEDTDANESSEDEVDGPEHLLYQLIAHFEAEPGELLEPKDDVNYHIHRKHVVWSDTRMTQYLGVRRKLFEKLRKYYKSSQYFRTVQVHDGKTGLSAESQLFVTLWFLSRRHTTYRNVANFLRINPYSVYKSIKHTCEYLCSVYDDVIKWPKEEEIYLLKLRFLNFTGLPGVVGYVCNTYVKLDPCHKYKKFSHEIKHIPLQLVFNTNHKIIHAYIGNSGRKESKLLFQKSGLEEQICNLKHNEHLIADSSYPCLENLLTPFTEENLDTSQIAFNYKIEKGLKECETNLKVLKSRFTQLSHLTTSSERLQNMIIKSCLVLFNLSDNSKYYQDHDKVVIDKDSLIYPHLLSKGVIKRMCLANLGNL